MDNNVNSFFKGLLLGTVAGAVAGILLAPKSGAETREDIKRTAAEFKEKATDLYDNARKELERKINNIKKAGGKLDETVYKQLVDEIVAEFKNDTDVTSSASAKLAKQLKADWNMVSKAVTK